MSIIQWVKSKRHARFNTQMPGGEQVNIGIYVDCYGMTEAEAQDILIDALKVKFRPFLKGLKVDEVKAYEGKNVTWSEMVSGKMASTALEYTKMTPEGKKAHIAQLQAQLEAELENEEA